MDNTRSFCITGTGTNVGKTLVTASLLRSLLLLKRSALAVKIIQTGASANSPLADRSHYRLAVGDLTDKQTSDCLHTYPLPASPHLATQDCGVRVRVRDLASEIREYSKKSQAEYLLFETAGGVRVPLNDTEDMLDLLADLAFPILLVAQNTLGAINHTLLTLEALEQASCPIYALILNQTHAQADKTEERILSDNGAILQKRLAHFAKPPLFVSLPFGGLRETEAVAQLAEILMPLARALTEEKKEDSLATLVQRDRRHIWHPYSRVPKEGEEPDPLYPVVNTYKNRIQLADGRSLIDGMSSWWSAIHGYRHPHIVQALKAQATTFPHVMFGGLTHAPSVRLAERLVSLLPPTLSRVFFADSGSVAVEVAMKMALQYQNATGSPEKTRFLTPLGGYHGDTMGAMSVCDPVNGMHQLFSDRLAKQYFVPRPACRFDQPMRKETLDPVTEAFAKHGHEICAVILEPIVQGAGGMWFYHPEYLKGIADLCKAYDCLLIFDEIATGFGHTGKLFALEWANVTPDILCLGKALTGGTMTLAATISTDKVAWGICQKNNVFMHGPTFMANPLACAVANASLDLLLDGTWQKKVKTIETILSRALAPCAHLPNVSDVRVLGDIGVVQTKDKVNAASLTRFFTDHGVWIRPFSDLVYIMPPYCTPEEDLEYLAKVIYEALAECAEKKKQAIN
ncbi:MAG: adenosylmethionine--8-amino-7-oxononanoate transaminase [Desulfovibrionaceae bacterium]|nr:adenosylmethionine--8-amino-7-oxononanoate transaminase [Desulfovibrionaceae bacterium]